MVIAKLLNRGEHTFHADIENETLRFVVILKPETDMDTVKRNRCGVSFKIQFNLKKVKIPQNVYIYNIIE
jgi:hypothetical protein